MKKFVALALCMLIFGLLTVGTFALVGENYILFSDSSEVDIPINQHIAGDANGDGIITLGDVMAALRYSLGIRTNTSRDGVDANGDGNVTVADVLLIIRHNIGDEVGLGVLVG